jgi:hypothetical protein
VKNKYLYQGEINVTGEEKEIFIRHKRHDNNKFPKKKIRDYKSPVVKNPILVEKYAKESSQKRDNLHKKNKKKI